MIMFLYIISDTVYSITKVVMFFIAVVFIFRAMNAIDFTKIFKKNSTDQIRFLFMVIAIVLGYLFVDAIISIIQNVDGLF